MIGLSKIAIGLVTCLSIAKVSGSIDEQLWVASRRKLISESDGRINSSKEESQSITEEVCLGVGSEEIISSSFYGGRC